MCVTSFSLSKTIVMIYTCYLEFNSRKASFKIIYETFYSLIPNPTKPVLSSIRVININNHPDNILHRLDIFCERYRVYKYIYLYLQQLTNKHGLTNRDYYSDLL